jgi:hypothetical protein
MRLSTTTAVAAALLFFLATPTSALISIVGGGQKQCYSVVAQNGERVIGQSQHSLSLSSRLHVCLPVCGAPRDTSCIGATQTRLLQTRLPDERRHARTHKHNTGATLEFTRTHAHYAHASTRTAGRRRRLISRRCLHQPQCSQRRTQHTKHHNTKHKTRRRHTHSRIRIHTRAHAHSTSRFAGRVALSCHQHHTHILHQTAMQPVTHTKHKTNTQTADTRTTNKHTTNSQHTTHNQNTITQAASTCWLAARRTFPLVVRALSPLSLLSQSQSLSCCSLCSC